MANTQGQCHGEFVESSDATLHRLEHIFQAIFVTFTIITPQITTTTTTTK
jgi:hypothetical protein